MITWIILSQCSDCGWEFCRQSNVNNEKLEYKCVSWKKYEGESDDIS